MKKNKSQRQIPIAWWKCGTGGDEHAKLAETLFDLLGTLEKDQTDRHEKNLRCARLYGNMDYVGLGPYAYSKPQTSQTMDSRVKYNIVSSMVDTVGAKISKMKPRVTFLTTGAKWSVQSRSKKLSQFVLGAFKQNDLYVKHQQLFKDASVFDIGAVKHFRSGGRIISERVLPTELYVDPADAMYGAPSHMYHVKYMHKDVACEMYPAHAAAIRMSIGSLDVNEMAAASAFGDTGDYVLIAEGWKLACTHDGEDVMGRHVICVSRDVLVDEEYKRDYFPFTFSRWSTSLVGFFGQSLADRLTGNQIEINKMLRTIQRSFHLGSAFKVFLEYGSKVAKEHINNEIGSLVYYQGQAPTYVVPKTVHEEFFRHLEWLIRSSYEEAGVSQLSSSSRLPAGIDGGSGKAIREYNDLETERFVLVAQQYEATFLDAAKHYVDLACDIDDAGDDFEVVAESKRFVETIKWSEVRIDRNQMVMQMFPTSMLPADPAGRLAYVQELIGGGYIDQAIGLSLLEFPDVEGFMSLKTAPLDDIMYTLESLLYKGKFVTPEPFQDLDMGIEIMHLAYLRGKHDGAPEANLDLLRRWINLADKMRSKAKALIPPQQAMPMQQGMPQGMPQPALPGPGAAPIAA